MPAPGPRDSRASGPRLPRPLARGSDARLGRPGVVARLPGAAVPDRLGGRPARAARPVGRAPVVYALSIGVYCTSWTLYGAVGVAAEGGLDYLAIYVGPILVFGLGWPLIARMIRIARAENVVSISDFISARYGKSRALAVLVTVIGGGRPAALLRAAAEGDHHQLRGAGERRRRGRGRPAAGGHDADRGGGDVRLRGALRGAQRQRQRAAPRADAGGGERVGGEARRGGAGRRRRSRSSPSTAPAATLAALRADPELARLAALRRRSTRSGGRPACSPRSPSSACRGSSTWRWWRTPTSTTCAPPPGRSRSISSPSTSSSCRWRWSGCGCSRTARCRRTPSWWRSRASSAGPGSPSSPSSAGCRRRPA